MNNTGRFTVIVPDKYYFSIFPYDKAYNRYLLDYNNTHDFNPDYIEAIGHHIRLLKEEAREEKESTKEMVSDISHQLKTCLLYTSQASASVRSACAAAAALTASCAARSAGLAYQ